MRRVAIASEAVSPFVRDSAGSITDLAVVPSAAIMKKHPWVRTELDAVLISSCASDQYLGPIISELLGLRPKFAQRIDNLCNSGTSAIVTGYSLIASGLCESVLVIGAEKKESKGNHLKWDITRGSYSLPIHWAALFAKAYMRRYALSEEDLASVSVRNRKRSALNPNALFQKEVTLEQVMSSKKLASPLKLLDCAAPCDGASSVLLVSEEKARQSENPVWIKGIGQQTESASFANSGGDLAGIQAARKASRTAFEMAGMRPSQIDIAELHDAFTILELMALEDIGFAKPGKAVEFLEEEAVNINPRGGILGCGHPVGATGVAQVAEAAMQLKGDAGSMQVKPAKTALIHNLAAAGSSATAIILSGDR